MSDHDPTSAPLSGDADALPTDPVATAVSAAGSGTTAAAADDAVGAEGGGGLEALRAERLAEVDALQADGVDPWPLGFRPDHTLAAVAERFATLEAASETGETVTVAGRILTMRRMGRLSFATIRDRSGDLQLFVPRQALADADWSTFQNLHAGDYVGVTGEVVSTKKGELSVKPSAVTLLAKALLPLPDKWKGIQDPEVRSRQRYVDLIVNPDARERARIRSKAITAIRNELSRRDYIEVEGPTLIDVPSGAAARPFTTHHHALDLSLFLRIALELPLKKLVVGGIERVYEIGRVYRNEGLSPRHNPEFTMLEAYEAFADYRDMMELTEALVVAAAEACGVPLTMSYAGRELDLTPPWDRVTILGALATYAGVEVDLTMPADEIRRRCEAAGARLDPKWGPGKVVMESYDQLCEKHLWGPVFVCDHPSEITPLAKRHRDNPLLAERFEAVVAGRELANAYSEQNDPLAQRAALEAQLAMRASGDDEAERLDEDFLRALEYGMPPTGGLGIGIDRLTMLLTGAENIRDVVLFPTHRPLPRGGED